jgi:predicted secreted protein
VLATEIFITFTLTWWVVFFIVLPFGFVAQKHVEVGHAESAPATPKLRRTIKLTTWITLFLTMCYVAFLIS